MSYQVLARKWRPKSFDELVGQKQTAKALINALETQRLHHAYLFTGTRGVGKTTIARILSKSLNCDLGISSTPCGKCSSCIEIDQGNFVDLMEIDAASKTKVEDTRELLDNVQYRPTRGRYKVYLIDEVHMLSGHSFNALLKTLEEPPPHVVFLLATTDPQKLPVTVLSRCLQFHLKRMELPDIVSHLAKILAAESIEFESEALVPIAKGADGSMRDALSLLDQAIAFSGDVLKLDAVLEMLGSIDQTFVHQILEAIENDKAAELMNVVNDMSQYSPDYIEVMSDWLSLLYQIAVCQATNLSEDEKVLAWADKITPANLQLYYQLSLQAKKDLPFAPHPRQGFEMALLRVLSFRPNVTNPSTVISPTGDEAKKKLNNSFSQKREVSPQSATHYSSVSENSAQPVPTDGKKANDNLVQTHSSFVPSNSRPDTLTASTNTVLKIVESPVVDNQIEPQTSVERLVDSNSIQDNTVQDNSVEDNIVQDNTVRDNNANQDNISDHKLKLVQADSEVIVGRNIIANILNTDNQPKDSKQPVEVSSQQILPKESTKKLPYAQRRLYPAEAHVNLEQVNFENWHIVVDQMSIGGNGLQVILNSIGDFNRNGLTVHYLYKVEEFLTENLRKSLIERIQNYFSLPNLVVSFELIDTIKDSPKVRQVKLFQQAIEDAHQDLIANSCVTRLQEMIGATVDRESISLK
ncbi:MAG: DNA polymerase III subunit gamma/tau [Kangiellaceae bacterium]|nr:DNA polymerase III subunit gamma/tau [Kangiellaceae bacterium]